MDRTARRCMNDQSVSRGQQLTCKRCKRKFSMDANSSQSCRYHPSLFTGGEVGKAIGFVRKSAEAEDQLGSVVGRTGLLRFWDCCGSEDEKASGCQRSYHLSFDEELNSKMAWEN
jgi:hypothetical protein